MDFSLTLCKDKDWWDKFVATSPQGNIFCTTPFLDALGVYYELLLIEENHHPQLGAVVLLRDGQPIRAPYPFTMYQGILFNSASMSMPLHRFVKWSLEVIEFLLTEMSHRYKRISFCLHHTLEDLRSFQWFHYHEPHQGLFSIELRYTALLELTSITDFNAYLTTIRKVRRYEYRQAQVEKLTVVTSDEWDTLNRLHQLTFERQGIKRSSEEEQLLLAISKAALAGGFGEILICKDQNGNAASATLFLYDRSCGYYLFSGNNPEYRNTNCGTYLMLENIRRCWGRGLLRVDLVGINSPNRGDFKTSFNAVPKSYSIVTWQ